MPKNYDPDIIVDGVKLASPYTIEHFEKSFTVTFEPYVGYYITSPSGLQLCFGFRGINYTQGAPGDNIKCKKIDVIQFSTKKENFSLANLLKEMKMIEVARKNYRDKLIGEITSIRTDKNIEIRFWETYESGALAIELWLSKVGD